MALSGKIAFAALLLAAVGASFGGTLLLLDQRDRTTVWPGQIQATPVALDGQATTVALPVQEFAERRFWSMSLQEPAQVTVNLPQGAAARFRPAAATPPTQVPVSASGAWVLPAGHYLFEAPGRGAAALQIRLAPLHLQLAAPQPIDPVTIEGLKLVDTLFEQFGAQAEQLVAAAKRRPELAAVGKILTQPLTEARTVVAQLEPATRLVGTSRPGLGFFTANDPSWIWMQTSGLSPVACKAYLSRARSAPRQKALGYLYINAHDSARDILPLKSEHVDGDRLCNEPLNKVTAGIKWL